MEKGVACWGGVGGDKEIGLVLVLRGGRSGSRSEVPGGYTIAEGKEWAKRFGTMWRQINAVEPEPIAVQPEPNAVQHQPTMLCNLGLMRFNTYI